MRDACVLDDESGAQIPITDIARSRADFPAARITFHLELICSGLGGLGLLCQTLEQAGLQLRSLRATEGGRISCILLDDADADLPGLVATLPHAALLVSWVTQIEFRSAGPVCTNARISVMTE